ncbi:hypothetical protein PYW08_007030 [Mythimna loreyi]|uniref:Uncharacterized protein n=1 Tax=Mythimna loreyi TaxID=667449 RepID=A0ACC2RB03_9NEOP|nr:hypothetical protein PYW08_007030 [Mythimna loreyi]
MNQSSMGGRGAPHALLMGTALILSLAGACYCETTLSSRDEIKTVSSSQAPPTVPLQKLYSKPLETTVASTTASSTTKNSLKTTKAYAATESPASARHSTTKVYTSTKGELKSARRQKLNSSSSGVGAAIPAGAHSPARLQERLAAVDCELPVLPRESRLWRGNETHELNLPVTHTSNSEILVKAQMLKVLTNT